MDYGLNMSPLTYVAGGVLLCALIGALTNQHYSWIVLGCSALGLCLPHWCEHPRLTEHFGPQTVTHSLLGLAVLGLLLSPLLLTTHYSLLFSWATRVICCSTRRPIVASCSSIQAVPALSSPGIR